MTSSKGEQVLVHNKRGNTKWLSGVIRCYTKAEEPRIMPCLHEYVLILKRRFSKTFLKVYIETLKCPVLCIIWDIVSREIKFDGG